MKKPKRSSAVTVHKDGPKIKASSFAKACTPIISSVPRAEFEELVKRVEALEKK